MFFKPKYKKIETISYKGYEIPIYSNGMDKFAGHPHKEGEEMKQNRIYSIDNISDLRNGIFLINKHGEDVDTEPFFPKSIGTVHVRRSKGLNESEIRDLLRDYVENK